MMGKKAGYVVAVVSVLTITEHAFAQVAHQKRAVDTISTRQSYVAQSGTVSFHFDARALDALGWRFVSRGAVAEEQAGLRTSFAVEALSSFELRMEGGALTDVVGGKFQTQGGFLLTHDAGRYAIGDMTIGVDSDGRWAVVSHVGSPGYKIKAFDLPTVVVDFAEAVEDLRLISDLSIAREWALDLGDAKLAGTVVGVLLVDATIEQVNLPAGGTSWPDDDSPLGESGSQDRGGRAAGPDVIVGNVHDVKSYGSSLTYSISAFSLGTIACNAGDETLPWYSNIADHPVIAQNLYRLKDGRFEQIGMSWLKHGFLAVSGNSCQFGCIPPPDGSNELGVGCSDPYSANLNGQQWNLGPPSDVNPHTGVFPYPWSAPDPLPTIGRRLQVHNMDLDPALNEGALYFAEGHYVHPADAAAGNQNNNASYRPAYVTGAFDDYTLHLADLTRRQRPAIRAWQELEPSVVETDVQIPDDGLLILSMTATDLGSGFWHYEYALQNLNSDRAVRTFAVSVEAGATIENTGFHDVDTHSGEPFDLTDWSATVADGMITWSTDPYSVNPSANALRWGMLYNFRFDADTPPGSADATMGLFKSGSPASVQAATVGPTGASAVCGNGVVQGNEECDPPNGITCDQNCLRIPTCGDGVVDPGEQCDPPDLITCDAACQLLSNSLCVDALAVCPQVYGGDTSTADSDGSASCGNSANSRDVWYRYTPSADGMLELETCGSPFDTVLSIHPGCPGTWENELTCNDDSCFQQSRLSLSVTADTTYLIRVSGYSGDFGAFTLTVAGPDCVAEPPVNDDCTSALPIREGTVSFDTLTASTSDPAETGECDVGADIWYCYQATCNGTSTVSLCESYYDTKVAVYEGCSCPTVPSASACNNDACLSQSQVSFAATTGSSYLIRVGGHNGATGDGTLAITCAEVGDPIRGGLIWDEWWTVNGAPPPTGDHPLYPPAGQSSGTATYRCEECHGWDYKGVDGAYGSGEHYTGIPGVWGTTLSRPEMFDLIKSIVVPNGHGFSSYGLSNQDIWDVIEFVETLVIDTDNYIAPDGLFLGSEVQGEINYTNGPGTPCSTCHGMDGTLINFGLPNSPEWVGTVATEDPWRLLHKVRIGDPGASMPSWLADGGTDQQAADIGLYARLNFPAVCLMDAHCNDGLYCNGTETCLDDACLAGTDECIEQACDEENDACLDPDPIRGGLLWDKWWVVSGAGTPPGDHPLYPPAGQQSGSTTFRCKECHGWDYKGTDGAYGSGSHYTGIPGVWGSAMNPTEMFDIITTTAAPNGHGLADYGLTEVDAWDLVAFMQEMVLDTDTYIDPAARFVGDEVQGQIGYTLGGSIACVACHGTDGTLINFGTADDPEWVGTIATYNPWEMLHKVRFGHPGSSMPSWLGDGGTDQGAADIGLYAQASFPADCVDDAQCDDGQFCTGIESCVDGFCLEGTDPCPGGVCDESIAACLSGLCDAPTVAAEGSRYLGVIPAPGNDPVALLVIGDPDDPAVSCMALYVQEDGTLDSTPVFQTPAQWGTAHVADEEILPNTLYRVRADCGTVGDPDISLADVATTWVWADANNNTVVNFTDAQWILLFYEGVYLNIALEAGDLDDCTPNRTVNFTDVQLAILVFEGETYADRNCPTPCP